MDFSRDIVAVNTPPTISVNEEWWEKEDLAVPTETVANSEFAKLQPQDTSIPEASPGAATISLPRACITPLALAHPLLTAPYLSPAAAYALLATRVHAWKWDAPLKPLMTWFRASLHAACPGVKSPPPPQAGRSHHSQPIEATKRDGTTHPPQDQLRRRRLT